MAIDQQHPSSSENPYKIRGEDIVSLVSDEDNPEDALLQLRQLYHDVGFPGKVHSQDLKFLHDTTEEAFQYMSVDSIDNCFYSDEFLDIILDCHRKSADCRYGLFATDDHEPGMQFVRPRSPQEQRIYDRKEMIIEKLIIYGTGDSLDKAAGMAEDIHDAQSKFMKNQPDELRLKSILYNDRLNRIIHGYNNLGTEKAYLKGHEIRDIQYQFIARNIDKHLDRNFSTLVTLTGNLTIDEPGRYQMENAKFSSHPDSTQDSRRHPRPSARFNPSPS